MHGRRPEIITLIWFYRCKFDLNTNSQSARAQSDDDNDAGDDEDAGDAGEFAVVVIVVGARGATESISGW